MSITKDKLSETVYNLNRKTAIFLPDDVKGAISYMAANETGKLSKFALEMVVKNIKLAEELERPVCGDTGVVRFYVKVGDRAQLPEGFTGLERVIRESTAKATKEVPLRPNAVDPLTRHNPNNNVGIRIPNIQCSFEPDVDWIELTCVHKGGIFGSDYRMLFPADGIQGIKKFALTVAAEFNNRGLACPPVVMGIGIGGSKELSSMLAKEAACLRAVGDRHPDPQVSELEEEIMEMINRTGFGAMGSYGQFTAMDVHIETGYCHPGTLPISIHQQCASFRRATVRIHADGKVEERPFPAWFTEYYRRTGF